MIPLSCSIDKIAAEITMHIEYHKIDDNMQIFDAEPFTFPTFNKTHLCKRNYVGPRHLVYDKALKCYRKYYDLAMVINLPAYQRHCINKADLTFQKNWEISCKEKKAVEDIELIEVKIERNELLAYCHGFNYSINNEYHTCPDHIV